MGTAIGADERPFTVLDSIGWARVLNFANDPSSNPVVGTALFSVGGEHFIIHARYGDLARNANVETLLLFTTKEVEASLHSSIEKTPQPAVLVQRATAGDSNAISSIEWLNERELAFIAADAAGTSQGFVADIKSRHITQSTRSSTDVVSFSVAGDRMAYYAPARPGKPRQVITVQSERLAELLSPGQDPDWIAMLPFDTYVGSRTARGATRVKLPTMRLGPSFRRIWLSPSGRNAVLFAPTVNAPPHWAGYRMMYYERFGFTPERLSSDPTSLELANRPRYLLLNIAEGTAKPLLDAPSGAVSLNDAPQEVFWMEGERSVVVTNTYLPLLTVDDSVRRKRASAPAIAEVDLRSGAIRTITWEPVPTEAQRTTGTSQEAKILSVAWDAKRQLLTLTKKHASGNTATESYERRGGAWSLLGGSAARTETPRAAVHLRQTLSERPKVYAIDPVSGLKRVLLDPNPRADRFQFGHTRIFKWKDSSGLEWSGGLVLPPDYAQGNRYPLVVQTHGFSPYRFLLDGPAGEGGTAMAAQALANAGLVVLQVEDRRSAFTGDDREGPRFAEGFRAGIAALIADGIADASTVGLIGFSRTGYHTLHLLASHPHLLAAANLADSVQGGYIEYVLSSVNGPAIAAQLSSMTGGPPSRANIGEWFARNPIYSLDRVSTAIRFEAMGDLAPLGFWEPYGVLRNANRPVDYILFPRGSHVLKKPLERLASQGGNVDWFRFWLQGYKDPQPEKTVQYRRWDAMRGGSKLSADQEGARR